uniref:Lipid droplet-associated hydrolase n=1 Tax=Nothobranchius furzeri TaxID=105023 RepID=A0A8C6P4K6_NOTFU
MSLVSVVELVLVGHSIGCYMILEMLKRNPELKVLKAILLFPTIERMAQSPQGKVMTPVLCQMRYLAYLPVFLLSLLPGAVQALLVRLVLTDFIPPAANSMYLGGQEMRKVLERDNLTIEKNLDKLIFYYGAADHWCPVTYFHDIRRDFPQGDFQLCDKGFRHAFVLDAGQEVAQMVDSKTLLNAATVYMSMAATRPTSLLAALRAHAALITRTMRAGSGRWWIEMLEWNLKRNGLLISEIYDAVWADFRFHYRNGTSPSARIKCLFLT